MCDRGSSLRGRQEGGSPLRHDVPVDPAAAADDDDERVEGGERRAVPLGVQQRQRRAASWLNEHPVVVEQRRAPGCSMMGVAMGVAWPPWNGDYGWASRPHSSLPLSPEGVAQLGAERASPRRPGQCAARPPSRRFEPASTRADRLCVGDQLGERGVAAGALEGGVRGLQRAEAGGDRGDGGEAHGLLCLHGGGEAARTW